MISLPFDHGRPKTTYWWIAAHSILTARMPTHTIASVAGGPLRNAAGKLTSSAQVGAILGYALGRHRDSAGSGISMRGENCCLSSWPRRAAYVLKKDPLFEASVSFVGGDFWHSVSSSKSAHMVAWYSPLLRVAL